MKSHIDFLLPLGGDSQSQDIYRTKNTRLFVSFVALTAIVLLIFAGIGYLNDKIYNAMFNLSAFGVLCIVLAFFKLFNRYYLSVNLFLFSLMTLLAVQHVVTPDFMGTNLIWFPAIAVASVYLIGPGASRWTIGASVIYMISADLIKAYTDIDLDQFTMSDILQYQIATFFIVAFVIWYIGRRQVNEEKVLIQTMMEQNNNLFNEKEENSALINLISHDISNPLQVLFMRVELAYRKLAENENVSEELGLIKKQGKRIFRIVDLVRNIKAVEKGKFEISLVPVLLKEALDETLSMYETKIRNKDIKINMVFPKLSVYVLSDPVSLVNSVLANFISNAIKFTDRGSQITFKIKLSDKLVKLSIIDQGQGIPEEIIPHLFSNTHRTNRVGTEGEQGTGFGMPIAYLFMNKYNGRIKVRSNTKTGHPKRGTTFELIFQRSKMSSSKPAA